MTVKKNSTPAKTLKGGETMIKATKSKNGLTPEGLEARREYQRAWRQEHKQLAAERDTRYWNKRGEELAAKKAQESN